jgi:hypothetical protein
MSTGVDRRLLGPMLFLLLLEVDPRISLDPLNGLAWLDGQSRSLVIIGIVVIAAVVTWILLSPPPFFQLSLPLPLSRFCEKG